MEFLNLYVQTEYSILSSAISLDSLFAYAKKNNIDALAIADTEMYGSYKFFKGCIENGIKPIIGMALDLSNDAKYKDLILLYAKDYTGYQNLMKLASIKKINGFGENKYSFLKQYAKGLIAIIPGFESLLVQGYQSYANTNDLFTNLRFMSEIFADFYLGLDVQTQLSKRAFNDLYVTAKANKIKMVALNKANFLEKDDIDLYQIIKKISLISAKIKEYECSEKELNSYLLKEQEALTIYANYPDLIQNTLEIKDLVNLVLPNKAYHFPKYILEDGTSVDAVSYLDNLAKRGLNKRLSTKKLTPAQINVYKERLLYELDVIAKMGFSDYFLVVYDYIRFAKSHEYIVGPGRGSGAGSLVCYCLGITMTDPIEYNLLFERFLNPERISMPDIDCDFPDNAREAIYTHLKERYGEEHVAHIGTFGTFKPRSAIRDVAKVMDIKDTTVNIITNYIPAYNSPSLATIASGVVDIKNMINGDSRIKELFFYASRIENMPRNVSTHASGIVISDASLNCYTPLAPGLNGINQTQYEASDIEDIGLVKFDILSVATLNTISTILDQIYKNTGNKLDINHINFNDQNVLALMRNGDTDGIFQFESAGMRKTLKDLKVDSLEGMIQANALYRPGPQEMIPEFIKRKSENKYVSLDPSLDEILKPTYGIIVYQEQIMLIAQKYAGFTLGAADLLRRAVSKKKGEEMIRLRQEFITGARKLNHSEAEANKIYDYIVKFANYGFNRSHSVVYSVVAYQMAYLKCYFYPYFMATLAEDSIGDKDKLSLYFASLRKKGYIIASPDINKSSTHFEIEGKVIYYPLQGVKDISMGIAKDIIDLRSGGLFNSYDDFVLRSKDKLNKRMVISLANAGAFDNLNITRQSAAYDYDDCLMRSSFSIVGEKLLASNHSVGEYDLETMIKVEQEALGINIKFNEFIKYQQIEEKYKTSKINTLHSGKNLVVAKIIRIREHQAKNGLMAFVSIADAAGSVDVSIFADDYERFKNYLSAGFIYLFEVMVVTKDEAIKIHVTNLKKL